MSEKDNDKLPRVTVHGKLAENTSMAKSAHQIYRYHVNILKPGQTRQLDYNREIYIYKPGQKQTKQSEDDESSHTQATPPPATQQVDNAEVTDRKDQPDIPLLPERNMDKSAQKKWRVKKPAFNIPALYFAPLKQLIVTIRNRVTAIPKRYINKPNYKMPVFNCSPITQALINLRNKMVAIQKRITGSVTHLINRFSIADLKLPPPRNIFVNTNKRHIGKLYLPCLLVVALAILIYYLPPTTKPSIPLSHESASIRPGKVVKARQDYRAVIKQNTDGVTITILGPGHEKVLTKLPPGYQPVVVGNKIIHVVTPGNTLWFIAKRYIMNPYRYPELVRLNNIKNPDLIYPGDRVIIQYVHKP